MIIDICSQCRLMRPCQRWRTTVVTNDNRKVTRRLPICEDCIHQTDRWKRREQRLKDMAR